VTDLHERLRAAIEERRALAAEAGDGAGGPAWVAKQARCECCERVLPDPGVTPGAHSTIAAFDDRISPHIVANDPATVLRHCAEDLDVLDRHEPIDWTPPMEGLEFLAKMMSAQCTHGRDRGLLVEHYPWPCPEIQSIARRYNLEATP
jgi:hypothetical protein